MENYRLFGFESWQRRCLHRLLSCKIEGLTEPIQIELLDTVRRNHYDDFGVMRISKVKFFQRVGFSIKEIQEIIDAPAEVQKASLLLHEERLKAQSEELTELIAKINQYMGYSCNSVNGMMVADGYLNCDVAAGKKAMDMISLSYDALQLYGIQEIADIEIGFYTTDDDYNYTYFTPRQVTTSVYENYDYGRLSYQDTITGVAAQNTFGYDIPFFATDKLYEQDGIVMASQALIKNTDGELSLLVELVNQTEDLRIVSVSDIFINKLLVEGPRWSSDTIAPGKRAVLDIELSSVLDERYWELYGIEDIGNIGFALQQSDIEWNELTEQEPIVVSINEAGTIDMSGEELYNQNGVRIVTKTVLGPASEYDSYFNVLLLAENTGSDAVKLEIPFNVLSINGFMVDYYGKTWELQVGQCALMEIQLFDSDLEEIKVVKADEITQVEFTLELKQGKTLIDSPTIVFETE